MKIEIIENAIKKTKYPFLGKSINGQIVFFTAPNCGVCLNDDNQNETVNGDYLDSWIQSNFTCLPDNVKIVLSNE